MSLSTVFKGIGNGIKTVVIGVARGFTALFGSDVAKQFATASVSLLKSAIGVIVTKVVTELASGDLSSSAKREEAVTEILGLAAAQGISVAESEVRLLIEVAVQFVKGKFTVAAA